MGEIIEVKIEPFCTEPKRFKIICCDGGVVTRVGTVELHSMNALVFEGENGFEEAKEYIDRSPRFILIDE